MDRHEDQVPQPPIQGLPPVRWKGYYGLRTLEAVLCGFLFRYGAETNAAAHLGSEGL
jgi:hypothetical protein